MCIRDSGRLADGRPAQLFTLDNGVLALSVTDYGATAVRLTVPTPDGTPVNVLLGYGGAAEYERDDKYLGATVGRCATVSYTHLTKKSHGKNDQRSV